jgi:hypothetical protein
MEPVVEAEDTPIVHYVIQMKGVTKDGCQIVLMYGVERIEMGERVPDIGRS